MLKPARQPYGYGVSRHDAGDLHAAAGSAMGVVPAAQRPDFGQAGEPEGRHSALAAPGMPVSLAVTYVREMQKPKPHQRQQEHTFVVQDTAPYGSSISLIPSMPRRKRGLRRRYRRRRRKHVLSQPESSIVLGHTISSPPTTIAAAKPSGHANAKTQPNQLVYPRIHEYGSLSTRGGETRRSLPSRQHSVAHISDLEASKTNLRRKRPGTAHAPRSMQRFGGGFQARPKTATYRRRQSSKALKPNGESSRRKSRRKFRGRERTAESLVPETSTVVIPMLSPRPPSGNRPDNSSLISPRSPRTMTIDFRNLEHRGKNVQMQRRGWSKPLRTPIFIRSSVYSQYDFGDARAFIPVPAARLEGDDDDANRYVLSPRGASMPPTVTIPTVSMKMSSIKHAYNESIVVPEPQTLPFENEHFDEAQ